MATPDFRLRDDEFETAGTPPDPSSDGDLDLAAPDTLASFGDAGSDALGAGSLYDPTEDPNAGPLGLDLAPEANYGEDALDDAERVDPNELDGLRQGFTFREDHGLGGVGEHGASDEVLGDLSGDDADFGPGSGMTGMGDTNSPSDEL